MPSFPQFNPLRLRSYILRLPLCTRVLLAVMVALYVATIPLAWLRDWAALEPDKVGLASLYRLNTFPLMHIGFFHMIFNVIALAPLLERFESEFGTLVTLVLFTGPFGLLPGGIYILLEKFVLRSNTAVMGASIWVFLLLSSEALKTQKSNPNFSIGPYKIPTWTTPLILIVLTSILVPDVSLIGHLCGAGIGYLWASGWIKFLVPHEKILRFIESKLNLLGRLPHYVSVDQKTYGRYGVLPTTAVPLGTMPRSPEQGQRLGP
ncbi:rhomboid protein 2 [Amniculicola lignicola CBS 123094]|uniref:rhomboid protease n=1 Tax=Amniculicola lignicola CBS 123094 TaxID=1392246 RepID=A0A6A5X5L9_9PLEO|nr:rhomboid protein 2 [Amniculicola lignicola CBS 123094]